MTRRAWLLSAAALLCSGVGTGACGPGSSLAASWVADLAWGVDLTLGWQQGVPIGPLGVAAEPDRLAVLDSFGGRLLVWRGQSGRWHGPVAHRVPAAAPLVAVALAPAGDSRLAGIADGAGGIWTVLAEGTAARVAALPTSPGELRRVMSLAILPGGPLVADVLEVTAERSSRLLLSIPAAGGPRTLLDSVIARADKSDTVPSDVLSTPSGIRLAMSPAGAQGVWLVSRRSGGSAELVRIAPDGRPRAHRPFPVLTRPVDFLRVDRHGLAYALAAAGTAQARVAAFDAAGRVRRAWLAPTGQGPRVAHPAAVDGDGALLLLVPGTETLRANWWPAGRGPRTA